TKRGQPRLHFRIVAGKGHEHTDAPHPLALLRARRKRPQSYSTDVSDELPPPHSMTSSARASSDGGASRPCALAVLTLISSSKFVGCSTRLPSLAPARTLFT